MDRPRARFARSWAALSLALRVLAVVLGLQVSGLAHFVEDAVSAIATGHAEHEDPCPADGPCDDCPPGCPQCHCPNAMRSVAAAPAAPSVLLSETALSAAVAETSSAPLSPDLPGLFRPPQTALVA
jgi:hypothetical protein